MWGVRNQIFNLTYFYLCF